MKKLILKIRNLVYCILLFLAISCKHDKRTTKRKHVSVHEMKLQEALLTMNNANSIDGAAVGVAGTRTAVYDSYEWLQKNAPDSVLISLTGYSNPYARTYAFMALCKRKSKSARLLFDRNMYDTSSIYMIDGCSGGSGQLNYVWLAKMHPLIDSSEYISISKKINKDYPRMTICFFPN
jgi:hypothetical protein